MRNKKIGTWIATLLITMLTFMGLGQTMVHAVAEGPETDVIITKVETNDAVKDMTQEEFEKGIDFDGWFSDGSEVLPGVSFTWFSVTDTQLATMEANPSAFKTVAQVEAEVGPGLGNVVGPTDVNGQVTISNLPEGNYWVIENPKGTITDYRAVPFGLILPFTNLAGDGYLETIHIYPKNTLTDDEPDIEKKVDESNVAIGEDNLWTITVDTPVGIEDYDLFKVTDVIDSRLDFDLADLMVKLGSGATLDKGTDYDASFDSGDLVVDFTAYLANLELELDNEGEYIAEQIVITYKTQVNDSAIMGQDIPNDAKLDFNNGHGVDKFKKPTDTPSVHTGGKAFIKIDGSSELALEGAEFKIQKAQGQFVNVGTNGVITFVDDSEDNPATVFTSDEFGKFEVRGLPYGDYVLVEIKAPQGYALPTDPDTDFIVNANSYHLDPTGLVVGDELEADVIETINNRRLVIPQTGGMGTVLFTVIGASVMLFSVVFYRRTKEV